MASRLNQKPFVIPIFIPHAGCPHRCVFCDQTRTTRRSEQIPTKAELDEIITRFLGYRKKVDRYTEVSFYGGNFLGLPTDRIVSLLEHVTSFIGADRIHGIRFSTRPDTITTKRLNLLERFPITTIEIGVQSMNDEVLAASHRGHTVLDIYQAVTLLKTRSYRLGLQMMVGLPEDTPDRAKNTARRIAELNPDFVRIYPTLVLRGSRLAQWHNQGRFQAMALEEAVDLVKCLYVMFVKRKIAVIRMGLQATEGLDQGADLEAGPYHPAFGELVYSSLWLDTMRNCLQSRRKFQGKLTVELHPRLVSRVKGQKIQNIAHLSNEFNLPQICISTNNRLPTDMIRIDGRVCRLLKYP